MSTSRGSRKKKALKKHRIRNYLIFKPQTLKVIHVAVAVEQIALKHLTGNLRAEVGNKIKMSAFGTKSSYLLEVPGFLCFSGVVAIAIVPGSTVRVPRPETNPAKFVLQKVLFVFNLKTTETTRIVKWRMLIINESCIDLLKAGIGIQSSHILKVR